MSKLLQHSDRVHYTVNGKKMTGTVEDALPFKPQLDVPVRKRTKTVWMPRTEVRKLPTRKTE